MALFLQPCMASFPRPRKHTFTFKPSALLQDEDFFFSSFFEAWDWGMCWRADYLLYKAALLDYIWTGEWMLVQSLTSFRSVTISYKFAGDRESAMWRAALTPAVDGWDSSACHNYLCSIIKSRLNTFATFKLYASNNTSVHCYKNSRTDTQL